MFAVIFKTLLTKLYFYVVSIETCVMYFNIIKITHNDGAI